MSRSPSPAVCRRRCVTLDAELRIDLDHADRLLESFLALARAQNGRVPAHDQVALEPLITDALCARAKQIAAKRLAVETASQPGRGGRQPDAAHADG